MGMLGRETSVPELINLVVVKTEVMSDFVEQGRANLLAKTLRIGKISQQGLRENCDFIG